ncbi:hypothetical protein HPULCUR_011819 [Helicostylum pulchrum]|uniref:Uncharacterized protein n=1 Tax=Helicostylum pulchrum TaxID=562976 RepID=A0ABP9YHW5_9FUNG
MSFYRRLIDYGLSVTKRHSASPVVLAIIIHNTTTELTNLAVASEKLPFLLELPCHGWTESCYLLNSSSISNQLQPTSLNPLVALGHFLIQQKPSLRRIDRNDDKTVQLLYTIAQQIFGDGLKESESVITAEDLDEIHDQCTRAKSYLLEDVLDESSRKRTLDSFATGSSLRSIGFDVLLDSTPDVDSYGDIRSLDYSLYLLQQSLSNHDKSLKFFNLPTLVFKWITLINRISDIRGSALLQNEMSYLRNQERQNFEQKYSQMNPSQKSVFDTITHAIDNKERNPHFFLQGPAGTGKTINEPRKKPTGSVLSNNDNDSVIKDWQFVDNYYEDHGSFNWEIIFKLGKAKELFGSYSKWTSAKSAYYRFKKQKQ